TVVATRVRAELRDFERRAEPRRLAEAQSCQLQLRVMLIEPRLEFAQRRVVRHRHERSPGSSDSSEPVSRLFSPPRDVPTLFGFLFPAVYPGGFSTSRRA